MPKKSGRAARIQDVHALASGMPHVTIEGGSSGNPVYQVGGKSFIFFRNSRPDAFDPDTGERYSDVIVFWVASEADKQALVQDDSSQLLPKEAAADTVTVRPIIGQATARTIASTTSTFVPQSRYGVVERHTAA